MASKPFTNRTVFFGGCLLTAMLTAGLALLISGGTSLSSEYPPVYPNQTEVQVVLGLILFGYYMGIAAREKKRHAFYFWGFFSGSLLIAVTLLGLDPTANPALLISTIGAIGTGIFFGITRPFLGKEELDRGIRYAIGGVGWGGQIISIIGSVFASNNGNAQAIVGVAIIAFVILYLWKGDDIKEAFTFEDTRHNEILAGEVRQLQEEKKNFWKEKKKFQKDNQ